MTKATVHKDKDTDSLTKAEVAAHGAFPEIFKAADPIIVPVKKPLSLETAGSELYAAIMNGEIHNVRGQLAHGDKVTEAEATMLIRARDKAREKGAKRGAMIRECDTAKTKKKKSGELFYKYLADKTPIVARTGRSPARPGTIATGSVSIDGLGGRYTSGGYEMADGSYLSTSGEFYNAISNTLTLANGTSYKMAEDLPVNVASVIRLAQKVRSVRGAAVELDFITPEPAAAAAADAAGATALISSISIAPASIQIVADAANIAAKAADDRAAEIMAEEAFIRESRKSPAAAIGMLDGLPELSAEDIHIAIQMQRKALRENRSTEELNHSDWREILEIREGLACVDTSSMKRCHSRHDHHDRDDSITERFNPASRQAVAMAAVCEVSRTLKACFSKVSNGNKVKAATPVHPTLAMA
jgi:hypothetical protein